MEIACNRINQDQIGPLTSEATGLSQRKDSLRPALTFVACGTKAGFAPLHGEAKQTFGVIVRGRHGFVFFKKHPEMGHFPFKTARKLSGLVFPVAVSGDQANEASIEHAPFAFGGWRIGHFAQPAQFFRCPGAKTRYLPVLAFGKPLGCSDQVGEAGLALADPLLIDVVSVT